MPWKYNGAVIQKGSSWVDDNGVTHPRNWSIWSDAEKTAAGMVWEDEPAFFNARFWYDANTPVELDTLKSRALTEIKQTANAALSETDWMVVKSVEDRSYAVPSDVLSKREAWRTASNTLEALVNATTTHAEFVALYEASEDDDGNYVEAPINGWPSAE